MILLSYRLLCTSVCATAIDTSGLDCLKILMCKGAGVNQTDPSGEPLLIHAIKSNKPAIVEYLLEEHYKPREEPQSPQEYCASGLSSYMLECWRGIIYQIDDGQLSQDTKKIQIHRSVITGNFNITLMSETVAELMSLPGECGGLFDPINKITHGHNALSLATKRGYTSIMDLLLKKGANPFYVNLDDYTKGNGMNVSIGQVRDRKVLINRYQDLYKIGLNLEKLKQMKLRKLSPGERDTIKIEALNLAIKLVDIYIKEIQSFRSLCCGLIFDHTR